MRDSLSRKATQLVNALILGVRRTISGSGNSTCKGPEIGMSVVYLKNRKKAAHKWHEMAVEE